ncbi:MAG: F0F1 ATP synthase subunit epsilon [Hyphomonas sp.]|jgi:F-type H+-transporting ATPase subunit epsilon|nr:F0F1 ATP synthase subunit epsilon [Hyphomonas sp.]
MAGTFKFELVSPERVLLSVDAEQAMVPGVDGDFTVFAGHAPLISTLRPGLLEVQTPAGKKQIFVKTGFADVNAASVTVLAETAFDLAGISSAQIADEVAKAEAELAAAKDDDARTLAQTAIDRLRSLGPKAN